MILLVSVLGTFRLLLALCIDVTQFQAEEVTIDFLLLVLFAAILVIAYRKANIKAVHPVFGIFFSTLLGINFLQFGGIMGLSRFNFFCGICVLVLLYSRKQLVCNLAFCGLMILVLCLDTFYPLPWTKMFALEDRVDVTDFIFALLSIALLVYYLKMFTVKEINQYDYLNDQLQRNVRQAREKNKDLVILANDLASAQKSLETEVQKKTKELHEKNQTISNYIEVNTQVLADPIYQLKDKIQYLQNDSLGLMMQGAAIELDTVYQQIRTQLEKEHEQLDDRS
ncbi:MAG: hypothetical protein ACKOE6_12065 [Flammeovirgaceae bacterium]